MVQDRPTFHESWYRVAKLRPKLHFSVQVYRQFFRGQHWYVLENPANNKFSRINRDTYGFVALLDGRRTVEEAWRICNDQLGDRAPTQGEVIRILGQLYTSNLLYAELAPDTESILNRYHKRINRQVQSFFTNLLFIRIPIINPDNFLERWVGIFGSVFSLFGLILWIGGISTGLYFIMGNLNELISQSRDVLAPDNLIFLYLSTVVVKIFHEFAHAFSCKKFGKINESGGRVHVMGIMFLVFMPLPFVDASSAWTFKRKRHRVIVGSAGVMFELFIAAIAAIVWSNTSTGPLHIIAYNIIFVASVSTLIFNGNPLLRFDAYYVLSDLIEIPNLRQRSWQFYYYLVKRYVWGLKKALSPANTFGEKIWLPSYGVASIVYRVFICVRILLFLNRRLPKELFILVPIFAFSAIFMWVVMPLGKFIRYLSTGEELSRKRERAVATTLLFVALLIAGLGILKVPDYLRVEGIVEPVNLAVVYVESDGFISKTLPSGEKVLAGKRPLVEAENLELVASKKALSAELRALKARWRVANLKEVAAAQILTEKIEALKEKIARVESKIAKLKRRSPLSGTWISPDIEGKKGAFAQRGQKLGVVANLDHVRIRATAGQEAAAILVAHAFKELEIRTKGRPDVLFNGKIEKIFPAGLEELPSQALGYQVGGSLPTSTQDPHGIRAADKFFEIRIKPEQGSKVRLLTGQRVVARFEIPSKPLALQWYRYFRQLFQRRFHV